MIAAVRAGGAGLDNALVRPCYFLVITPHAQYRGDVSTVCVVPTLGRCWLNCCCCCYYRLKQIIVVVVVGGGVGVVVVVVIHAFLEGLLQSSIMFIAVHALSD
jgi:hypothetical protein